MATIGNSCSHHKPFFWVFFFIKENQTQKKMKSKKTQKKIIIVSSWAIVSHVCHEDLRSRVLVIPAELVRGARPPQLALVRLDVVHPHRVAGGTEQPGRRPKQLVLKGPITGQGRTCEERRTA